MVLGSAGDFGQAKLEEAAIAVCINDISCAVMMASPSYLQDFALGFALSEGLITSPSEVLDISTSQHGQTFEVNIKVLARTQHTLKKRRRVLSGPTGCGLCGIDSIDNAMSLPTPVTSTQATIPPSIIEQAKAKLTDIQNANHCIQGHHSAVYFDLNANALAIREDVGRHNALDKLIGCLYAKNLISVAGFVLLTSRCSHDLVTKTARCNLPTLVTLGQPTNLAVSSALATNLNLFSFVHGKLTQFS